MDRMLHILTLLFLLVSCNPVPTPEPEQEPEITFSSNELVLSSEGGESSLKVSASAGWSIATDGQTWYALVSAPQVYAGESILKVSAEPNYTTAARTATLRFTSGNKTVSLKLSQAFFVPELTFSQTITSSY